MYQEVFDTKQRQNKVFVIVYYLKMTKMMTQIYRQEFSFVSERKKIYKRHDDVRLSVKHLCKH